MKKMLRMFTDMNGLGGLLLVVIVLMALVFASARFDYVISVSSLYHGTSGTNRFAQILTSDKGTEEGVGGEEDSTYAFYASKRRRASSKYFSMLWRSSIRFTFLHWSQVRSMLNSIIEGHPAGDLVLVNIFAKAGCFDRTAMPLSSSLIRGQQRTAWRIVLGIPRVLRPVQSFISIVLDHS
ncbi:uncharacterized protein LY79DRAFT_417039 [Colletotrichum navitas]|uniref:Uncharacterized protein n=1 Tax=Colletotrichum navitas TaxID=681940 RepID=A0AAD8UZG3_9PEZI|nr:uncharacterized protein LY79DRAFT_417039 [Colletotrichum navitas]KAK1573133.1 hypothetical protein LY79DRAFT_417039 [Colletotrichum navitas]